jgi:hypothetical protein
MNILQEVRWEEWQKVIRPQVGGRYLNGVEPSGSTSEHWRRGERQPKRADPSFAPRELLTVTRADGKVVFSVYA